jgi:hypothetical protein
VTERVESPFTEGVESPVPPADGASTNGAKPTDEQNKDKDKARGKGRAPRQPKTLLEEKPPPPSASHEAAAAWLTGALRVRSDPVAGVIRYGRHEDARTVIVLRSGLRITFDRARDLFDARILVRRVVIATGGQVPAYAYADAVQIATVAIRLAELEADNDDREEAREWADDFLIIAERNTLEVEEFSTPTGRWCALSDLRAWKPPLDLPTYAPAAERSVILLDKRTGDRYVRTSDFAAHVRGHHGVRVSWGVLHSRMEEIGWRHLGEVQQRQPQTSRHAKVHLYEIPAMWPRTEEQVTQDERAARDEQLADREAVERIVQEFDAEEEASAT